VAYAVANDVANREGTFLSPQELSRLVEELVNLRLQDQLSCTRNVRYVVAGWAAKSAAKGIELTKNDRTMDGLWGLLKQTFPVK
jgi:hypothetical protein